MDWEGQRIAEQLMQYVLLGSALVAFLVGYLSGSFSSMLYIYLAGVVVTFLATVPNWPFLNRHPFTWLEPACAEKPSQRLLARRQAAGKKGGKSSQAMR
jgi:signal peptidase complex subunit 1